MLIGRAFEVITQTGCLTAACENILTHMKKHELWIIPVYVYLFFVFGFTMGLTYGFSLTKICEVFTEGCKRIMKGVLIIGIAETIRLVISEGCILDTITYSLTQADIACFYDT